MILLTKTVPCARLKGVGDNDSAIELDNEQGMTPLLTRTMPYIKEARKGKSWCSEEV